MEDNWWDTLKNMAPFGLNIEESVQQFYYQYIEHLYCYRTGTF